MGNLNRSQSGFSTNLDLVLIDFQTKKTMSTHSLIKTKTFKNKNVLVCTHGSRHAKAYNFPIPHSPFTFTQNIYLKQYNLHKSIQNSFLYKLITISRFTNENKANLVPFTTLGIQCVWL